MTSLIRSGVLLLLVTAVVGGCQSDPAAAVATRIRAAGSPVVRDVVLRSANYLDPAGVDVWLRAGATEAEADALWCDVIEPTGGSNLVAVWNDMGTEMMAVNAECAPRPS
jgi:hypothetical protein